MNTKFLAILNFIVDAVDKYLFSTVQPQFVHSLSKSFKRLIWFIISLSVFLLSTWTLVLLVGFFYLLSIGFTHIQASLILLAVNLIIGLLLFNYLRCLKKRVLSLRRSGLAVILTYMIRAINNLRHK